MKKYFWLLFISFSLLTCEKEDKGGKDKKEEEIVDGKEPKVTDKYYLKFKIDDKWIVSQTNNDNNATNCSYCVNWWDGDFEISISEFFSGSLTKSVIKDLEGKSITLHRDISEPVEAYATIESDSYKFTSCCTINEASKKINITKVTDPNKKDVFTDEHIMIIEGNFDNIKVKEYRSEKEYTLTKGTFKVPVSTSMY